MSREPTRRGDSVRVAVLIVGIRSDGGAEALLRTLFDELSGSRYEFEVFTLRAVRAHHLGEMAARSVPTRAFPARRLIGPVRFVRLLRAIRSGGFDVIHTNLPAATILGVCCGTALGIPTVATLHNSETSADRHWYQGRLETFLLNRFATRVIAVGEHTADARREVLGNTEVHVLPNAVAPSTPLTLDQRTALRSTFMKDATQPLALSVGRLTTQKAHGDLINAWAYVHRSSPGAELAIAGRGQLLADLEQSISDLGLGDVVHLLGSRSDVRELMHAADVFVMSSKWEGLPVALLEAMEADLPLVSTAVGDVPAVMRDACGLLVEPGRVDELSVALSKALVPLPCSGAGTNRKIVEDRYSSRSWARAMADHYDAAMDQDVARPARSLSQRIRRVLDSTRRSARRR